MSLDRRSVLKGLAAVGFAMANFQLAHARHGASSLLHGGLPLGTPAAPVTPIVTGSALDSEFLSGVQAATAQQGLVQNEVIRMQGLDSALFGRLSTLLNAGTPATLVGLADDASAALILDLVRSAGGRVLSSEHHRIADDLSAAQVASALGSTLVSQPAAATAVPGSQADGAAYVSFCCVI
jgi:hypothetical protein